VIGIALMGGRERALTSALSEHLVSTLTLFFSLPPPAAGCCHRISFSPPSSSLSTSFLQSTPLSHTSLACQARAMTSKFPGPVRLSSQPQINLQLTSKNRWPGPVRASSRPSACFRPILSPRASLRLSFFAGFWNTKNFQDPRFGSN
jgi:hypothetical protein